MLPNGKLPNGKLLNGKLLNGKLYRKFFHFPIIKNGFKFHIYKINSYQT